jgi:hypothetical protein
MHDGMVADLACQLVPESGAARADLLTCPLPLPFLLQAADCLCLGMVLQLLLPWVRSGLGPLHYWLAVGTVLGVVPMAMAVLYERALQQSCAAAGAVMVARAKVVAAKVAEEVQQGEAEGGGRGGAGSAGHMQRCFRPCVVRSA